jgi:hypothetical protein
VDDDEVGTWDHPRIIRPALVAPAKAEEASSA